MRNFHYVTVASSVRLRGINKESKVIAARYVLALTLPVVLLAACATARNDQELKAHNHEFGCMAATIGGGLIGALAGSTIGHGRGAALGMAGGAGLGGYLGNHLACK